MIPLGTRYYFIFLSYKKQIIMLIGRQFEKDRLLSAYESEYSEFVAVYGRRRVGKTFLIRETFNYKFTILADNYTEHKIGMLKFVLNGTEKKISKAQDRGGSVFAPRRVSRRTEPQTWYNDGRYRSVA